MKFELPQLNYEYSALEPYIDEATMRVHHDKHHRAYMDKFQAVVDKYSQLSDKSAEQILEELYHIDVQKDDKNALRNNGGGYVNHNLYFASMAPDKNIDDNLIEEIQKKWGSIDKFKEDFSALAASHFGSGWAWLARDEKGDLQAYCLPNQESPVSKGHEPVFNLDLWEHAYYLKYQNKRPEYIENWWKVLKLLP